MHSEQMFAQTSSTQMTELHTPYPLKAEHGQPTEGALTASSTQNLVLSVKVPMS